jgi:SAM-dependent methyltransferase
MSSLEHVCHVCGQPALRRLGGYPALPRVSSDCRPVAAGGALAVCEACGAAQKPATPAFLADIGAIYAAYDVYYQGGGAEQIVFDSEGGGAMRRSALLTSRIAATGLLPGAGSAIDIGCGNGALLRQLAPRFPGYALWGLELDDRNLAVMQDIPGFQGLHVGELDALEGSYTLVTMVHALEHFTNPFAALSALRSRVAADGFVYIQVPNLAQNPFDLLIADHATHFTPASLEALLIRAGYAVVRMETEWVKKELSVLARPVDAPPTPAQAAQPQGLAQRHLGWLDATLEAARRAAEGAQGFGVFGTSIAATWLAGGLAPLIDFHVDEDASRQGRDFFGKPILPPSAVPPGATVFLALAPAVAEAIAARLAPLGIVAVKPPALDF